MTPRNSDYSEEALVERPAMNLFSQLGWSIQNCFHEFDENGKSSLDSRKLSVGAGFKSRFITMFSLDR